MVKPNNVMECQWNISFPETYVYKIVSVPFGDLLAVSLSDQTIRLVGKDNTTRTLTREDYQIQDIISFGDNCLGICGEKGSKIYDVRSKASSSVHHFEDVSPFLCMDAKDNQLVVGTELKDTDAGVIIWDLRAPKKKLISYMDSHNDDVTQVKFHPTQQDALLSGSMDGLINIYNTSISDEDEAVFQVINHNVSIHKAGFLSEKRVYALSHSETFAIYQIASPEPDAPEPAPNDFGDVRDKWDCEYVIDIDPINQFIACGKSSNSQLNLIPFNSQKEVAESGQKCTLKSAHGEEVVRSVLFHNSRLYTGGEDGIVKQWEVPEFLQPLPISHDSTKTKSCPSSEQGWSKVESKRHSSGQQQSKSKRSHNKAARHKPY